MKLISHVRQYWTNVEAGNS